jgi:hypothetical protein
MGANEDFSPWVCLGCVDVLGYKKIDRGCEVWRYQDQITRYFWWEMSYNFMKQDSLHLYPSTV